MSDRTPQPDARLARSRLSNRAAEAIKRRIVGGAYPPGARLPTEKALSEELGVTRLTIREALSQLSATGFIESRHGSGTYVLDLRERESFQLLSEMLQAGRHLTPEECISVLDFRARVVGAFADAIVASVTPEQVAALRALVGSADAASEPQVLAALDYRFNEVLAQASGSWFLVLLLRSMREVHLQLGAVVYRDHGDVETVLSTLRALVDALSRRRPARFAAILQTYLRGAIAVVSAQPARPTAAPATGARSSRQSAEAKKSGRGARRPDR